MNFKLYLSSPTVLIIDPLFLREELLDYFHHLPLEEPITFTKAEKINKTLFPHGGSIIGFYQINSFVEGEYVIDASEIFRIFEEDFEEYDLSEECLFGVDSGEILVIEWAYIKEFIAENKTNLTDSESFKEVLARQNYLNEQNRFDLIEAFDIDNSWTEFTGDGRYVVTEDFLTLLN
ncbi:hypothetical protein [Emticicia agri]|uniref:Uncharacterized protein n=1 Tax=Emticicia agri TaxID=2492393 RepID=A0A4Q5LVW5_9BACT|nr:hypothetical protein [Emticicia agri]RYU93832.1 hypothetical protein EWM59_20135 [Emticicia agri]